MPDRIVFLIWPVRGTLKAIGTATGDLQAPSLQCGLGRWSPSPPVFGDTCPVRPGRKTGVLMADSRRLLLELIDDLLVVAREAAGETRSIGRLVASVYHLDLGKARSAAVYLKECGFSGHAVRLTEDVERLQHKGKEAFRVPYVAEPTPDDRKQERQCLAALHSEAHRLLQFLNELNDSLDGDDDAVATDTDDNGQKTKPLDAGGDIGRQKGVSLRHAAERIRRRDPKGQKALCEAWRKSRTPKLPVPIGKCKTHRQRNLYEPAALLAFLKKFEGEPVDRDYHLSGWFRQVSDFPRSLD